MFLCYGGFYSLSLKIDEKDVEGQWSAINDVLKKLPRATFFHEDESEIKNPNKEKNIIFLILFVVLLILKLKDLDF